MKKAQFEKILLPKKSVKTTIKRKPLHLGLPDLKLVGVMGK
jgi:hypothetical protein